MSWRWRPRWTICVHWWRQLTRTRWSCWISWRRRRGKRERARVEIAWKRNSEKHIQEPKYQCHLMSATYFCQCYWTSYSLIWDNQIPRVFLNCWLENWLIWYRIWMCDQEVKYFFSPNTNRKVEDLQFRVEEACITKGDLEVNCERMKQADTPIK